MIKAFDLRQGNLPLLVSMPHPGTLLTPEVAQAHAEGEASGRYRLAYSLALSDHRGYGGQHVMRPLFPLCGGYQSPGG